MSERKIYVGYVAREEGDGALDMLISAEGKIKEARFKIWESPRFFEAFLVGRKYEEVPEIVQRICGICPHPHHLSAVRAVEMAMGIQVSEQTKLLRHLLLLGDYIMSHSLHVFFLAAPDYLGYESVVGMASNPELLPIVQKALQFKRLGNDMSVVLTGHEIQNRTSVVGGFTAVPSKSDLLKLRERLAGIKDFALETCRLAKTLTSDPIYADLVRKCEHVALRNETEYAVTNGRLVSTEGLDVAEWEYPQWLIETHVPGCNAKHAIIQGRDSFMVGPLARVNLNFGQLSADAQAIAREIGFEAPDFNPYMSIVARGIELVNAIDDSIKTIDLLGEPKYEEPKYTVKAGEGYAITEAPRGICTHGGKIDKDGIVQKWDIVAPTARNVYNIEKDLNEFVPKLLHLSDEELTLKCEMLIRSYDPCLSCSVHSLKVKIRREV
jgi:coenzyme F420-reducing hydrogenase alpha subunit